MHNDIEGIELESFFEAIRRRYGYDFRFYTKASIKRRVRLFLEQSGYMHLTDCLSRLLRDESFFYLVLSNFLISVTEMFRDPSCFKAFLAKTVPILKTYPFIKIWHAGCASGEEVYSLAILLNELGFSKKYLLYGTDINPESLKIAQDGIYKADELEKAAHRYLECGGRKCLSNYFTEKYGFAKIHDSIKENIVFSRHNLECDSVFGDMNAIFCRNVLIYFKKPLQNKVVNLFHHSLVHRGFLFLGPKESLEFIDSRYLFETVSETEKIYRKK